MSHLNAITVCRYPRATTLLTVVAVGALCSAEAWAQLPGPGVEAWTQLSASAIEQQIEETQPNLDAFRGPVEATTCGFQGVGEVQCARIGELGTLLLLEGHVAVLPPDAPGTPNGSVPFLTWSREENAIDGASRLEAWRSLINEPFDCNTLACRVILPRALVEDFPDEDVLLLCSTADAGGLSAPPRECEPIALMAESQSYVRTWAGWGPEELARAIGFAPSSPASFDEVVFEGLVRHTLDLSQSQFVEALERGFSDSPFSLQTDVWPLPDPVLVEGSAAQRRSAVIRPAVNEWVTAEAITTRVDRPLHAELRVRISLTLLVNSRATSLDRYRRPDESQAQMYRAAIAQMARTSLAGVCGSSWSSGSVLDCRPVDTPPPGHQR